MRTRSLLPLPLALAAVAFPATASGQLAPRPRSIPPLERAKANAERSAPPSARPAAPTPRTQLFSGLSFAGLAASSNAPWAGYTPPDETGAVGGLTTPEYVELVNSMIAVYDASNGQLLAGPSDLQQFIKANGIPDIVDGSATDPKHHPGDSIFDIQVQWDAAAGRWLYASADVEEVTPPPPPAVPPPPPTHLVFGWSKTDDAAGDWCFYRTPAQTEFEDYPKLGHDDTHLIVGANEFETFTSPRFLGATVWTVDTPGPGTITTCAPQNTLTVNGPQSASGGFTPVPVNIADASTTGYVVATPLAGAQNTVRVYRVAADGTVSATTSSVPVQSWSAPADVPQPGTAGELDSQDARLTQAVGVSAGMPATHVQVWTQHTVASADGRRSDVRWYELDVDPSDASKVQEGDVSDLSNFVFNGAVSPTADGAGAALHYNVGGPFHLVEARGQTRDAGTPLGTMENEHFLGGSSAADVDFSCTRDGGPCRWGDYAGATPDPVNTDVVWGTNQLIGTPAVLPDDPSWTTRNFAIQFGGPDPAPDTTFDGPFTTNTSTPAFNFASSETGSTFTCALDGGAFAACTPGKTFGPALANGSHTFKVFATDASGQPDPSPDERTFTVAAPPPDTTIDSGPPAITTARTATFGFHSSRLGATFQCSLDGSPFAACSSPMTTGTLGFAQHAFAVRSIDTLGNIDPTPATSSFTVVQPAARFSARRQRVSRKRTVKLKVICPAGRISPCRGSVTLKSGHLTLGIARFRVPVHRSRTITVKLRPRAFRTLVKKKHLRVKAQFRISSPAQRTTKTFTLLAPKRRS